MASLFVLKGGTPGQRLTLEGDQDKYILGRNPDCDIVIPGHAVSRQHAQITVANDSFFIEDLGSRNGTFVNNQQVNSRTQLKDNDRVKICDFLCTFHLDSSASGVTGPQEPKTAIELNDDEVDTPSTVQATVPQMAQRQVLEAQSNEKLRAILEVSNVLSKTLQLDVLLPQIADILFQVFKQADRCFVIEKGERADELIPRTVKTRRPGTETTARFSKTIVRKCLDSCQSLLFEDAMDGGKMALSASIAEFRIRSVICAPLVGPDGKAFGLIHLDSQDRSKKFSQDDLKLLVGVANQAAIAWDNAKMHKLAVQAEKEEKEKELAKQVQL